MEKKCVNTVLNLYSYFTYFILPKFNLFLEYLDLPNLLNVEGKEVTDSRLDILVIIRFFVVN